MSDHRFQYFERDASLKKSATHFSFCFHKRSIFLMEESPTSSVKLSPVITQTDENNFKMIMQNIENYSISLVQSFETTVSKIHNKLCDNGKVALKSLSKFNEANAELNNVIKGNAEELEKMIGAVDDILDELKGLDTLQSEILLLSDLLTTVEDSVKRTN